MAGKCSAASVSQLLMPLGGVAKSQDSNPKRAMKQTVQTPAIACKTALSKPFFSTAVSKYLLYLDLSILYLVQQTKILNGSYIMTYQPRLLLSINYYLTHFK